MSEITYNTNCWENSWKALLTTNYLKTTIKNNNYNFNKIILWINNVKNYDEVSFYANKLVQEGVLTNYYNTDEYIEEALNFFKLNRSDSSLGRGYPYSVGSLCAIYYCKTKYILYFTDDAYVPYQVDWIPQTLKFMEQNEKILTGNLMWARGVNKISWNTAKRESYWENEEFFVGYGFSDQNYLGKTQDFKNLDYNTQHELSDRRFKKQRKPGTSFEKRIEAWKLNNKYNRATYKNGFYIHAATLKSLNKRIYGNIQV